MRSSIIVEALIITQSTNDLHWAQNTMEASLLLHAFPGKYFPITDQSESDVLKNLWLFIDKAFDDTAINTRRYVVFFSVDYRI